MTTYRPPLHDMQFVLEHICDVRSLAKLEAFQAFDPDSLPDILAEAGRFFSEVFAPLNRTGDTTPSIHNHDGSVTTPPGFREAYEAYVDAGWGAVAFDPELGGGGLPWTVGLALQEMMTASNLALSLCPLLTQGGIHLLDLHASEDQRDTYLPKLIAGDWTATMLLTEPHAGSDLGALSTRAERAADGSYRLVGQKIFITWGEHDMAANTIHLVLARTPDAPPGSRGISCFIVPKYLLDPSGNPGEHNDITCVSIEHKMGIHASPTCVMSLGEAGGAVGYLIGEENMGLLYMFTMMNNARLGVGLEGVGVADRAYQQALDHAGERLQGRRPDKAPGEKAAIIEHPDVRRMLLTQKAFIEAMRCLCYYNATVLDLAQHHPDNAERQASQELCDLLTPLSKAWCTDVANEMTSVALQVHGGMGYVEETGASQYCRDVRIAAIYEGTNGIQAIDLVGRKLPVRGGAVVHELLDRVAETAEQLHPDLAALREPLTSATAVARSCTDWLLANPGDAALAGATPYLRLLASVVGAWLLARSAEAARAEITAGATGTEAEALQAKQVTAEFFCHQLLPQAAALAPAVTGGAEILAALSATQLR
ncbi:MAG: acyl-CoA dehydrogenase [Acidimicrobiia bacterium]|nr:acyl-CoA dehydrogenase [Acidimicrobiia bacterium]MYC44271.1 acyl-CoA dehydrogenase [Acidimicrobiia bacterium]